jgi:hypothetical protein
MRTFRRSSVISAVKKIRAIRRRDPPEFAKPGALYAPWHVLTFDHHDPVVPFPLMEMCSTHQGIVHSANALKLELQRCLRQHRQHR